MDKSPSQNHKIKKLKFHNRSKIIQKKNEYRLIEISLIIIIINRIILNDFSWKC